MADKRDCFAYRRITGDKVQCTALNEKECEGCKFYKNRMFYEDELLRCDLRKTRLGISTLYEPVNAITTVRRGRGRGRWGKRDGKKDSV